MLSHGQWNRETQRYECQDEPRDVEYTSSRKVGDPIEWTKDKTPINLN